ncbi:hypothetical protein A6A04_20365 [Paramagnetospirillum marisnigri]|uniref:Uncharacterized protein n=2 Tax=Paramagnetospirillum marisnigri TaxID=1285242 RepID=A0A178MFW3_9PROT|nr:hypothetical protein A6A04_20365 [Paramagnetospirillum marisnigri]
MVFSQMELSSIISSLYFISTLVLGLPCYIALLHCGCANAIEAVVCGVEAVVLGRIMLLSAHRAWPLSIAANGFSAMVGRYVF